MPKKAVVLLSGGLDSTTTLFYALDRGHKAHGLTFDYGQRHTKEIRQARVIARKAEVPCTTIKLSFPWKGSSLLDPRMKIPRHAKVDPETIPSTYVPGRNIIFLSFAASYAEAIGADDIFIGANAVDYSGYPDCRPEFFQAYTRALKKGTRAGVKGAALRIRTPLIRKTKAQIVRLADRLGVPFHLTWSCYRGGRTPCGTCDSCRLRRKGFEEAGVRDSLMRDKR